MLRSPISVIEDLEKSRLPPTPPNEHSHTNYQPNNGILLFDSNSNHRTRELKDHSTRRLYDSSLPPYRSNHNGFMHFAETPTTPLSSFLISLLDSARNYLVNTTTPTLPLNNYSPSLSTRPLPSQPYSVPIPSLASIRFALLCTLWYASSALSSNTGKAILAKFRYPVTLTWIQFGFVGMWCALFCCVRASLSGQPPLTGIRKASKQALRGTVIMSFFQIAGHVFSSMAIARVPVSTVHTIKALSPLFTVASYAILFRVRYSPATYSSLLPLTVGVMLACSFDFRGNGVGFLCALGSTIVFVSQNIYSKKLLPPESGSSSASSSGQGAGKLDKVNLLLYASTMAFLLMIPIWFYSDGPALFFSNTVSHNSTPTYSAVGLMLLFAANGTVHFAQGLLAFTILARCSPVTYSIASLFKRLAVIVIAIVWFHQPVYALQAVGMALTFVGLWMYNRAKADVAKGERKRVVVEKRQSLSLPTSNYDLDSSTPLSSSPPSPNPHSLPPPYHAHNLPYLNNLNNTAYAPNPATHLSPQQSNTGASGVEEFQTIHGGLEKRPHLSPRMTADVPLPSSRTSSEPPFRPTAAEGYNDIPWTLNPSHSHSNHNNHKSKIDSSPGLHTDSNQNGMIMV